MPQQQRRLPDRRARAAQRNEALGDLLRDVRHHADMASRMELSTENAKLHARLQELNQQIEFLKASAQQAEEANKAAVLAAGKDRDEDHSAMQRLLGPFRGVSRPPPAVPPSPRSREAERVLRTEFAGGIGIAALLWWSPPPAVLAGGGPFRNQVRAVL